MAKEHLIKAKELIEGGWTRITLKKIIDGVPCYCLDGAIAEAHGYDALNEDDINVYDILEKEPEVYADVKLVLQSILAVADSEGRIRGYNVWHNSTGQDAVDELWRYNDRMAQSKEDVIAVLDVAINLAGE
jgi:hypothetical protein